MNENDFEPLIAAHDFVSSRLLYFFNNDEFAEASFVANEFEVFGIFLVTIGFIQDNENVEQSASLLEQFHKTIVERIVARIVDAQVSEVSEEQEEALHEKILTIFQERLRLYFNLFQKGEAKDEDVFMALSDIFIENGIQNHESGQVSDRFSAFAYELFQETVTLLKKSLTIKECIDK